MKKRILALSAIVALSGVLSSYASAVSTSTITYSDMSPIKDYMDVIPNGANLSTNSPKEG